MSAITPAARPEPVLQKAKVTQAVGLVGPLVVAGLIAIFGLSEEDATYGVEILGILASAVVAVVNFVVAKVQASKTRALVTPKDDPRDDQGRALTPTLDVDGRDA